MLIFNQLYSCSSHMVSYNRDVLESDFRYVVNRRLWDNHIGDVCDYPCCLSWWDASFFIFGRWIYVLIGFSFLQFKALGLGRLQNGFIRADRGRDRRGISRNIFIILLQLRTRLVFPGKMPKQSSKTMPQMQIFQMGHAHNERNRL